MRHIDGGCIMCEYRKLVLMKAATGLTVTGSNQYINNSVILLCNRLTGDASGFTGKHDGEMPLTRRQLIRSVRENMQRDRQKYSLIGWSWLMMWIIPKLVTWFITWYLNRNLNK